MKVALVHPDLSHKGGSESLAVWQAVGLAQRGHEVRVFSTACQPGLWPGFEAVGELFEAAEAEAALPLEGFAAVLAHGMDGLAWSLPAPGRVVFYCHEPSRKRWCRQTEGFLMEALHRADVAQGQPALAHLRHNLRRQRTPLRGIRRRFRERLLVRRADARLTNSRYTAQVAQRCWRQRFEVVEPAVPGLPPVPATERLGLAIPANDNPKKNLHGALAAVAELVHRGVEVGPVHVWGSGTDAARVRETVRQLGLTDVVKLHGRIDDPAAARLLAAARACLYLPFCEPFGIQAVEAVLAEVPLVASNHAGPAEIQESCPSITLVDPLRPDRIADALAPLLKAEPARKTLTATAENTRQTFSLDRHLDRLEPHLR